jgi:hypothetical protein
VIDSALCESEIAGRGTGVMWFDDEGDATRNVVDRLITSKWIVNLSRDEKSSKTTQQEVRD